MYGDRRVGRDLSPESRIGLRYKGQNWPAPATRQAATCVYGCVYIYIYIHICITYTYSFVCLFTYVPICLVSYRLFVKIQHSDVNTVLMSDDACTYWYRTLQLRVGLHSHRYHNTSMANIAFNTICHALLDPAFNATIDVVLTALQRSTMMRCDAYNIIHYDIIQ